MCILVTIYKLYTIHVIKDHKLFLNPTSLKINKTADLNVFINSLLFN